MTEGLLTIAYGQKKYIRMAEALALSYRRHDPTRPIALVTDQKHVLALKPFFDVVIPVRLDFGIGVVQKLHADLYSPFDKTLFVDADCLFYKDPELLWRSYAVGDFGIRGWRYLTGKSQYEQTATYDQLWDIGAFLSATGINRMAHFNSGVFYFTKSDGSAAVFRTARSIYEQRSELNFTPFKNAPIGDEPAFAAAIERCGIEMLPWDSDRGMETAINIERTTEMDVLHGIARFQKGGEERNPVLVHFNVGAQYATTYGRDILRLRYEKSHYRSALIELHLAWWIASNIGAQIKDRVANVTKKLYIAWRRLKKRPQ